MSAVQQYGQNSFLKWTKINILILSIVFALIPHGKIFSGELPFRPGEKLTFNIKWTVIPAGTAVLEVMPEKNLNEQKAHHFVMTVKTNSFVDKFYKVRDKINAFADLGMNHSVLYKNNQKEGKTRRKIIVKFDWDNNKAQYSNTMKKKKLTSILPGTFDPLSIFYYSRMLDLKENETYERPVTDGKKCKIGQASVIKKETIKVPAGTYETFLVVPDLKDVGGVFKKSKDATIKLWVTADERRIPVKIKSKVVVGSFTGELVSASGIK